MKPFNTNPDLKKWGLVAGLVVALGSTISLNPESKYIARNDGINTIDMASTKDDKTVKPQSVTIALDGDYKGIEVKAAISGDRAIYEFQKASDTEGASACIDCAVKLGMGEVTLKPEDSKNIDFIQMALKKAAVDKLKEQKIAKAEKKEDGKLRADDKKEKKQEELVYETACESEDEEGTKTAMNSLLSCQREEILELVGKCDDAAKEEKEKSGAKKIDFKKCSKLVKQYYNTEMRKLLKEGLSMTPGTVGLNAAIATRDLLLSKLPGRYTEIIAEDLTSLSKSGLASQAKRVFQQQLKVSNDPKSALTAAQLFLYSQGDLTGRNPWTTFNEAAALYRSMDAAARRSQNPTLYEQLFETGFYQPIQGGIKTLQDKNANIAALDALMFDDGSGLGQMPIVPGPGQNQVGQPGSTVNPTQPRNHGRVYQVPQYQNQQPQGQYPNMPRPVNGTWNNNQFPIQGQFQQPVQQQQFMRPGMPTQYGQPVQQQPAVMFQRR
ncbi:MAG: hypothetical protein BroJett040_14220 [Oligoflexia bacterium]|nr:MAG: hypothetical protein BroJett040_14220 [Oligoflexia bacterium]